MLQNLLGCAKKTPFKTMESTSKYWTLTHIDKGDLKMEFITWFLDGKKEGSSCSIEFFLSEYRSFFKSNNGIVTLLDSKYVAHGTKKNYGFIQIGIALTTKKI
jgi:hypothetical protein